VKFIHVKGVSTDHEHISFNWQIWYAPVGDVPSCKREPTESGFDVLWMSVTIKVLPWKVLHVH